MMQPLIADGGELTVLRSLASHAWGQWQVEWPESVPEDQRPQLPDDREQGFVYSMDRTVGRMGRRFVRADVSITASEYGPDGVVLPHSGASDVEEQLDAAATRTDGDAFFEREITREGLGPLVPYSDFDVGDVVPVSIWGRVMEQPVMSIEAVSEAGAVVDWRVHVGGALLADDTARRRANEELERVIAQERRERLKGVAQVSSAASAAQKTADSAVAGVGELREVVAQDTTGDVDLVAQLSAVNAQLQQLGSSPQPSLMLAFVELTTRLWQVQEEIDLAQDEALEAASTDRAQIHSLIGELQEAQARADALPRIAVDGDGFWSRSGSVMTAIGSWTGLAVTVGDVSATLKVTGGEGGSVTARQPVAKTLPVPQADGSRTYAAADVVLFQITPGVQKTLSRTAGAFTPAQSTPFIISALSWSAQSVMDSAFIEAEVLIPHADRGSLYRLELVVAGQVVAVTETTTLGPLTPLGSGRRRLTVTAESVSMPSGASVRVRYTSSGASESQREVESAQVFASWIDKGGS